MGERFEGSPAFWTHTVIHNTDQEQKVTAENTEFAEESLKNIVRRDLLCGLRDLFGEKEFKIHHAQSQVKGER
jgi:hypothetical protein